MAQLKETRRTRLLYFVLFLVHISDYCHWYVNLQTLVLLPTHTLVLVPTFLQLQVAYNVDYTRINYTVALPALALAVSPLFWTPLADIYGRRTVMIVACFVAFVASIGSALANNYAGYMVARFMQGWGVGPASTVGLTMLQDIYSELERGEKVGYWTLAIDLGTSICATLLHNANSPQASFSDL